MGLHPMNNRDHKPQRSPLLPRERHPQTRWLEVKTRWRKYFTPQQNCKSGDGFVFFHSPFLQAGDLLLGDIVLEMGGSVTRRDPRGRGGGRGAADGAPAAVRLLLG